MGFDDRFLRRLEKIVSHEEYKQLEDRYRVAREHQVKVGREERNISRKEKKLAIETDALEKRTNAALHNTLMLDTREDELRSEVKRLVEKRGELDEKKRALNARRMGLESQEISVVDENFLKHLEKIVSEEKFRRIEENYRSARRQEREITRGHEDIVRQERKLAVEQAEIERKTNAALHKTLLLDESEDRLRGLVKSLMAARRQIDVKRRALAVKRKELCRMKKELDSIVKAISAREGRLKDSLGSKR